MKGQLIDVLIESDDGIQTITLAKIIEEVDSEIFKVKFLYESSKTHEDLNIFKFEKETSEIHKESVQGYYDSTDIEVAGYTKIDGVGYVNKEDLDNDYEPSESEDDDDDDDLTDLEDEGEDEEEEN